MPLYEYQCAACAHRFEVIQKFSDAPLTECPKCSGTLRKLQSAPAFQLKGTGWYATDYPKSGQTPADKGSGGTGESSSSGDKDTTKGEKSEKTEKAEKTDKANKSDKAGTSDKADKATTTDSSASASAPKSPSKDS